MAEDDRSMIPDPILSLDYVLARFSYQSLFRCCCVSKPLLNLVKHNSEFARIHYKTSEPQLMIHCRSLFRSKFLFVDLDADTTSQVEVNPTFELPLLRFEPVQSSNGLLLLEYTHIAAPVQRYIIYNPITGEYVLLPKTVYHCRNVRCAFLYTPGTNQFKVFRVFHRVCPSDVPSDLYMELYPFTGSTLNIHSGTLVDIVSDSKTKLDMDSYFNSYIFKNFKSTSDSDSDSDSDSVYSASDIMGEILVGGSDSWESLGNLPFSPLTVYNPCQLDKTTHWLCADENVPSLIVFFNFETHQVGEIPGPTHMNKTHSNAYDVVTLVVLGKCLSIFDRFTSETKFAVWVMKDYGDQDSWTLKDVIDTSMWQANGFNYYFRPVICRENEEVVMLGEEGYMIFYDLSKTRGRIFNHPQLVSPWDIFVHTPSLFR